MCQESRHQARSKSGCRYIILLRTLGNDPFGALFGLFHKRRQRTVREYSKHRMQQNECSFIAASALGMIEHARWCISFGCARTVSVQWGSAAAAACPWWHSPVPAGRFGAHWGYGRAGCRDKLVSLDAEHGCAMRLAEVLAVKAPLLRMVCFGLLFFASCSSRLFVCGSQSWLCERALAYLGAVDQ